jgi:hypothetical protein
MPRIHERQMTMQQFADALKAMPADEVPYFDFCHTRPTRLDSYRGYYEDVALGWTDAPSRAPTCNELAASVQARIGKTQEGYKGGTYTVYPDTAIWVANHGETGDTAIVGVRNEGWAVIIETAYAG